MNSADTMVCGENPLVEVKKAFFRRPFLRVDRKKLIIGGEMMIV